MQTEQRKGESRENEETCFTYDRRTQGDSRFAVSKGGRIVYHNERCRKGRASQEGKSTGSQIVSY